MNNISVDEARAIRNEIGVLVESLAKKHDDEYELYKTTGNGSKNLIPVEGIVKLKTQITFLKEVDCEEAIIGAI